VIVQLIQLKFRDLNIYVLFGEFIIVVIYVDPKTQNTPTEITIKKKNCVISSTTPVNPGVALNLEILFAKVRSIG